MRGIISSMIIRYRGVNLFDKYLTSDPLFLSPVDKPDPVVTERREKIPRITDTANGTIQLLKGRTISYPP